MNQNVVRPGRLDAMVKRWWSTTLVFLIAGVGLAASGLPALGAANPAAAAADPIGTPTGLVAVGTGSVESHQRQVVRTAQGRVYIVAADDDGDLNRRSYIRMYRAAGTGIPSAFAEADNAHAPWEDGGRSSGTTYGGVDARLDRTGIIHVAYFDTWFQRALYATFDTNTDQWSSEQVIGAAIKNDSFWYGRRGSSPVALALDADGTPNVILTSQDAIVAYRRTNEGWSAGTTIQSGRDAIHPSVTVDRVGRLHLAWLEDSTNSIRYAMRDADGQWSASRVVATGELGNENLDQSPSIAVDGQNRPVVLDLDADDYMMVRKLVGDSWVDQSPPRSLDAFAHAPGIHMRGDDVFALMGHDRAIHPAYMSRGADGTWSGQHTFAAVAGVTNWAYDGSANSRFDPINDTDCNVVDIAFFDEDSDTRGGRFQPDLFYAAIALGQLGTTACGTAPAAPTVTTGGVTASGPQAATINGTINPNGDAVSYQFEFGKTTDYGSASPSNPASLEPGTTSQQVSAALSGLEPRTAYHYRLVAIRNAERFAGADQSFTTASLNPPAATTGIGSSVSSDAATVTGAVNPNGQPTRFWFEYGTSAGYGSKSAEVDAGTDMNTLAVQAALTGLLASTTYHFRVVARNVDGTSEGADQTFTTSRAIGPKPEVLLGTVTAISTDQATISGSVNPRGSETTYRFEYGTTTSYGESTLAKPAGASTDAIPISATISGLEPGKTYHWRLTATNLDGDSATPDASFSTAQRAPVALTGLASGLLPSRARLEGAVNPNGLSTSYRFEYGTTTAYGSSTPDRSAGEGFGTTSFIEDLSGLQAGTLYHYRLRATSAGGTAFGVDATFTTPASPLPPLAVTGAVSGLTSASATLRGTVSAQGSGTTYHFEFGPTIGYGRQTADIPVGTDATGLDVAAGVSELQPSTMYHFRIVAHSEGGTASGADGTFTTAAPLPSNGTGEVGGSVPGALSLSIGSPAYFGTFAAGTTGVYHASMVATVVSTGSDAVLSVEDPSTTANGRLVNGAFSLTEPLRALALNDTSQSTYQAVSSMPLPLATYDEPVSQEPVELRFEQRIAASQPMRTGKYGKTLTFTLSLATP